MELIHIPPEILEHIFTYLDGQSFCRIKLVCKQWYEIGKQMQVRNSLWKEFCIKEIPKHILEDILSFKSVLLTDKIIDWCVIYKKWFHGKMIGTSPYWNKLIKGFCYNPVTCVKISGSFVITGHSNGCLCVWNQYNGELCQKILCHLKMITDMALVDLLNLGSYYGSEELPWAHHHIITVSKDYYIQVKSLLEPITINNSNEMLNFHSDVLCGVRVYGNQFAVCCRDNTITIWSMHLEYKPYFHLDVSLVQSIIGPRDIFFNFGFWQNEVYCVSHTGGLNVYSEDKKEWIETKHFLISYSEECLESVISVTAVFIYRNQIIIMLTADGKMVVSVNKRMARHHYLMKYLHTVLVSVALNGTILALGGENGKLFLYHVPDDDHLDNLQLSNPTFALQLSDASIIAIDILHDSDSPVIVAATNESIYVIKWYSIHKSHQEVKRRDVSHLFKMH